MKTINDLRDNLFETIQLLKAGKIDVSKAKTIAELSQVVINSAKVEVDFIKEMGGTGTGFIQTDNKVKAIDRPKAEYTNEGYQKTLDKYAS